ncbi:MAG TPA: glycine-rich protein [Solirubrobacteraceae bacterium]|nr:glycine-rich protein [Solirubrobacteraceae bacterium]
MSSTKHTTHGRHRARRLLRARRRGWHAVQWLAVAGVSAALASAFIATGTASAASASFGAAQTSDPTLVYGFTGSPVTVTNWPGYQGLCLIAKGGDGAGFGDSDYPDRGGGGALISGCMRLDWGQDLQIAVGGRGHMQGVNGDTNFVGGWGYAGATGGNGGLDIVNDGSEDPKFASGGGGGATIVSYNGNDLLVAGGGGGQGGGSLDESDGGAGGSAGPIAGNGTLAADDPETNWPAGQGGAEPGPSGGNAQPGNTSLSFIGAGGGGGGGVNGGGGAYGSWNEAEGGSGGGAGSSLINTQILHGTMTEGTPGQNQDGSVEIWLLKSLDYQLVPANASISAGRSVRVPLEIIAPDGTIFKLKDSGVTWRSTVEPDSGDTARPDTIAGDKLTMYTAGAHYVTASLNGTPVATVEVKVLPGRTTHLGVTPAASSITAGQSDLFRIDGRDADGNVTGDLSNVATLSSDASSDVITGDTVAMTVAGPQTISASVLHYHGQTKVTVDHAAPTSIAFASDDTDLTVPVGSAVTFAVDAHDQYGNEWTLDLSQYGVIANGDTTSINSNTLQFDSTGQYTATAILNAPLLIATTQVTVTGVGATRPARP